MKVTQLIIGVATLALGFGLVGCAVDAGGAPAAAGEDDVQTETETLGEQDSALCKNALSAEQERTTLKLIDDVCGDTWCSGDYNYQFQKLSCHAGKKGQAGACTLRLRIFPREGVPSPKASYTRTCTTGGFQDFASLVLTTSRDFQFLQPDYYDALTECISGLEAALPR